MFFDTYERTAPLLDRWLRRLYAGGTGTCRKPSSPRSPARTRSNPNLWGDYLPVIADVPLEPFSEAEARQFLASKNITDESTIEVILTLSGRLPMWLATLAEARPADAADIGDPAGDAVERFLKWEDDPAGEASPSPRHCPGPSIRTCWPRSRLLTKRASCSAGYAGSLS